MLGQRSGAESASDPRKETGRRPGCAAEIRGTGSDRDGDPGGVWRHGNGSAVTDGDGRTHGARRLLRRMALGAHWHRHAANRLLWNCGPEAEISAEAGKTGDAGRLCAHRASGGVGCAGGTDAGRSLRGWKTLHVERPEDVEDRTSTRL